ncbi:MAG: glutamate-cysteine ligase family protein [bacterium]
MGPGRADVLHRTRGKYLECTGLPFRRFLAEGLGPHRATLGDFGLHLSTLFPDARLKQHLEVRGADMGSRADVVAVPALHMGLFYDKPTLHEALALWDDVDAAALAGYRRVVAVEGLHGRLGKASAQEWSTEMIRLAKQGLSRWQPSGERYLDGLAERVGQGRCPADDVRDAWTGDVALMAPPASPDASVLFQQLAQGQGRPDGAAEARSR